MEFDHNNVRIDTFRSKPSRINMADDAVRLTWLPTGKVFESSSYRSPHSNRAECYRQLSEYLKDNEPEYIIEGYAKSYGITTVLKELDVVKVFAICKKEEIEVTIDTSGMEIKAIRVDDGKEILAFMINDFKILSKVDNLKMGVDNATVYPKPVSVDTLDVPGQYLIKYYREDFIAGGISHDVLKVGLSGNGNIIGSCNGLFTFDMKEHKVIASVKIA